MIEIHNMIHGTVCRYSTPEKFLCDFVDNLPYHGVTAETGAVVNGQPCFIGEVVIASINWCKQYKTGGNSLVGLSHKALTGFNGDNERVNILFKTF